MTNKKRMWSKKQLENIMFAGFIGSAILSIILIIGAFSIYSLYTTEHHITGAQILEEAGWEKVCVEWECLGEYCSYSEIKNYYDTYHPDRTYFFIKKGNDIIDCYPGGCFKPRNCTRWTWLPPEEALT